MKNKLVELKNELTELKIKIIKLNDNMFAEITPLKVLPADQEEIAMKQKKIAEEADRLDM